MVGIVIVTHSVKTAEGIVETASQMASPGQRIIAAGGAVDGSVGTDAMKIGEAIRAADDGSGVVVLVDLGSAIFSTETALELLEEELRPRVRIADAPVGRGDRRCGPGFAGGRTGGGSGDRGRGPGSEEKINRQAAKNPRGFAGFFCGENR